MFMGMCGRSTHVSQVSADEHNAAATARLAHSKVIMAHAWSLRRALLQVLVPRGARATELLPLLGCWRAGRGPRHHRVPAGVPFQIL